MSVFEANRCFFQCFEGLLICFEDVIQTCNKQYSHTKLYSVRILIYAVFKFVRRFRVFFFLFITQFFLLKQKTVTEVSTLNNRNLNLVMIYIKCMYETSGQPLDILMTGVLCLERKKNEIL